MDRHVDAFLEMLAAERGAARNTLLAYGADLADFAGFAGARGAFIYDNAGATGATTQTLASLTTQAGNASENSVQVSRSAAQSVSLIITSLAANASMLRSRMERPPSLRNCLGRSAPSRTPRPPAAMMAATCIKLGRLSVSRPAR